MYIRHCNTEDKYLYIHACIDTVGTVYIHLMSMYIYIYMLKMYTYTRVYTYMSVYDYIH